MIPAGWHQRRRLRDIDSWRRRAYSRTDDREHEHEDEQEKGKMSYFLFFIATALAGTINALAGGGGLITFPLLTLVVTPVTADATSAIALFFAYPTAVWRTRDQLAGVLDRGWLWLLLIPSVLGGFIGAVLLSRTDNRNFIQLVPWLALVATVIIVLRPILVRRDESGGVHPEITVALARIRRTQRPSTARTTVFMGEALLTWVAATVIE